MDNQHQFLTEHCHFITLSHRKFAKFNLHGLSNKKLLLLFWLLLKYLFLAMDLLLDLRTAELCVELHNIWHRQSAFCIDGMKLISTTKRGNMRVKFAAVAVCVAPYCTTAPPEFSFS